MTVVSPRSVLTRLVLAALLVPAAGVVAVLVPTQVAWAQAPAVFEGQGLVELLPPSGLVGDGASPAQVYLLALSPAGTPLTGLKGKPTASAGTTTEIVEQGGGLYSFTFTPAKSAARQDVTLTLKAKTPAKEQIARTWTVGVTPSVSHPITVAANPASMTLGQDKTASVSITLVGADSIASANADLRINSSAGTVGNLTNLGNGQFSALYTAPVELFPRMALITVSDRHDPSRSYGAAAIPLVGKADFPVSVTPNAKVIIRVGGREFGPVQADASGKAKVPIVVPPGASGASLVQIGADGKSVEGPLDLKIPDVRRIAMFPMTAAVPGDGGLTVPVRAMVVTPDGKPDGNAQVAFAATTGVMGPARHEGGGIYVASYTPPNSLYEGTVGISVSITGGSKDQTDKTDVKLLPMRAMKVDLTSEPATLPSGTDAFSVKATVTGSGGTALPGRTVAFTANGAKLKDVKDNKNGTYQANFTTTGSGPAEVSALSSVGAGGNPLARVIVVPARDSVPNDGLSSAPFLVVSVDDYGYPVANMGVSLKLLSGDGTLPATVTTGADGTAQVYYTAGRKNGLVSIEAAGGGTTAAASILQLQGGVAAPELPTGGPKAVVDLTQAWSSALATVKVERAGATGAVTPVVGGTMAAARPTEAAPAAVTPTAAPPPAGGTVPTKVTVGVLPAMVPPGTTAALRITVTDAAGKGVAGQSLDFLTSAGTVTDVKDVGGGVYSANLAVPSGATGEIKVSAATRDGSVSSFIRVPVGTAVAAAAPAAAPAPAPAPVVVPASGPASTTEAWGSGGGTTTAAPAPAPTTTPTMPTTTASNPPAASPTTPAATPGTATATTKVVTPSDWGGPWMRLRAGAAFGSYAYTQTPLAQDTSLFPTDVPWSAGAAGLALHARAFSPGFQYVGVEVGLRSVAYSVDPASLCSYLGRPCDDSSSVGDWLTNLHVLALGRYTFDSGSSRYWAGARVGYGYGDVQGIQASADAIDFPQFRVNALAIGAELGAEFMDGKLFLNPAFTEYLAGGSSPYDTSFSVEVGYAFLDNVYASVNYDLSVRKVSVLGEGNTKVGEISDSLNAVTLSVGTQF